jgi:hypothetical protein
MNTATYPIEDTPLYLKIIADIVIAVVMVVIIYFAAKRR